jgi:cytokinesis protein
VRALTIKHAAEASFDSLLKNSRVLTEAHEEVMQSLKFRKVLEVVLAVGNFMNGTGFRGGAYGFNLSLLNKLKDTRGEGGTNLLEFIGNSLRNADSDAVDLAEDWPSLKEAVRCKLHTVQVKDLQVELTVFEKQLAQLQIAFNSQSEHPLDLVKQKLAGIIVKFEAQMKQAKTEVEAAEQSYIEMCRYLAVDINNEEAREVLPLLLAFLNDFTKAVNGAKAVARRPLKANELQMKIRMKRQEARQGLAQ